MSSSSKKKKKSKSKGSSAPGSSSGMTNNRYDLKASEVSQHVRDMDVPSKDFLAVFKENFRMEIIRSSEESIQFEMIGVNTAVANALRRILISEVPTVAIETVYLHNNTSIIQDEVLSHRLGLVPIDVEPEDFQDLPPPGPDGEISRTDKNTLVFVLEVTCRAKPGTNATRIDPDYDDLEHGVVYSRDLKWDPKGSQAAHFEGKKAPRPVHDDIVIAKLRPGQTIHLEAHCNRGLAEGPSSWYRERSREV